MAIEVVAQNARALSTNINRPIHKVPELYQTHGWPTGNYINEAQSPIEGLDIVTPDHEEVRDPIYGYIVPQKPWIRLAVGEGMGSRQEAQMSDSQREIYERLRLLGHGVKAELETDDLEIALTYGMGRKGRHDTRRVRILSVAGQARIPLLGSELFQVTASQVPQHRASCTSPKSIALVDFAEL